MEKSAVDVDKIKKDVSYSFDALAQDIELIYYKKIKRYVIVVFGLTVLVVGIAMILLPGPAILVIPLGLAILGTEFLWARRLLKKLKARVKEFKDAAMSYIPK